MGTRLASSLREWMGKHDLTEDDVGREFGVHQSTAHRWLSGVSPGASTLQRIAAKLEVSVDTLLDSDFDVANDSIGMAVLASDELHTKISRFADTISALATQDDLAVRDQKILLITAEGLIESVDELRPSLAQVVDHLKNLPST